MPVWAFIVSVLSFGLPVVKTVPVQSGRVIVLSVVVGFVAIKNVSC